MANQLAMDKALAIKHLQQAGYSERKIAEQLGVTRKAVRYNLGRTGSKDTKAPTGLALTGSEASKDTKALTGSEPAPRSLTPVASASLAHVFHDTIVAKLDQGLTAQRIFQDLQSEHGFSAKYHSVRRYIAKLRDTTELPFRRLKCDPGAELQVDFGSGAKCQNAEGKWIKTHVFRAVLSHSRKGYSEAVTQLTIERFIQVLENTFWRLGGVPTVVIFDNGMAQQSDELSLHQAAACQSRSGQSRDHGVHARVSIIRPVSEYGAFISRCVQGGPGKCQMDCYR